LTLAAGHVSQIAVRWPWRSVAFAGLLAWCSGCGTCGGGASSDASPIDGDDATVAAGDSGASEPEPPRVEETIARAIVSSHPAVIYAAPDRESRKVGVLRWGAVFEVSDRRGEGDESWVRMKGVGWVESKLVKTNSRGEPKLGFVPVAPDLKSALPYRYVRVTAEDGVPVYRRPPRKSQDPEKLVLRRLKAGYYFTLDKYVNMREGYHFKEMYRSTRYWFVPREGTDVVSPAPFGGIEVTDDTELPFLWVTDPTALLCPTMELPPADAGPEPCAPAVRLKRYPFVQRVEGAGIWYRTSGGQYLASTQVAFVDRIERRPREAGPQERWIHVDLRNQFAALYEGDRMTYVTLISSGDDEHETPAGTYRIESKHITTTMDNEEDVTTAYFIQDVPWVMYFKGAYGLHGAFWHDRFGLRTSHGCVNLAPGDAQRFFEFASSPEIPEGWHGVYTPPGVKGTLVHITE
jgi:hypothetical protein